MESERPEEDGLLERKIGPWTRDKLAILEAYFPAFGTACSKKARRWYYVDGLAGPGVNVLKGTEERYWGSPMLALRAKPEFTKCLLLERDRRAVAALAARTAGYEDRCIVQQGDVNVDLLPKMHEELDRRLPCLVLLDPEGIEPSWSTVEQLADFRLGRFKTELLILFNVRGLARTLPLWSEAPAWVRPELRRFFGNDLYLEIWARRRRDEISAAEAETEYIRHYARGLTELGYRVLNRDIRARSRTGQLKYVLLFATTNPTGERIMEHCYRTVFPAQEQLFLPGLEPAASRDLGDLSEDGLTF